MNLFFSLVAGHGQGQARRPSLFFITRKELQRESPLQFGCSLFLLQNIQIFLYFPLNFLSLPSAWECTKMDVSLYLLCSMLLFCFLIRRVNPSLWRRRLRQSVRPLPAVPAAMNLMTCNQSLLIAINRRIQSTTMRTSINLFFFMFMPESNRVGMNTINNFTEIFFLPEMYGTFFPGTGE